VLSRAVAHARGWRAGGDSEFGHTAAPERIGDDLGSVRVPGWTGRANDAFLDDFAPQKKRWHQDFLRTVRPAAPDEVEGGRG
jgi:hypothetical protein